MFLCRPDVNVHSSKRNFNTVHQDAFESGTVSSKDTLSISTCTSSKAFPCPKQAPHYSITRHASSHVSNKWAPKVKRTLGGSTLLHYAKKLEKVDGKTLLFRDSMGDWHKVGGETVLDWETRQVEDEPPLKTLTLLALDDKGACAFCSDVAAAIPDCHCIYLPLLLPSLTSFAVSEASGQLRRRCTGQSSM
eukprot:GHVU01092876.1.p1 GENE.GHVU01092876.1~~GHVU01092876.1.p1  ORF type:complete len:191 (+),score=14.93 GHVU01092876.1:2-574(+)